MRKYKQAYKSITLTALLFAGFTTGAFAQDNNKIVDPEAKTPVIISTTPMGGEMNTDPGTVIEITFSSEMNEASINASTLVLYATRADTIVDDSSKIMLNEQIRDSSNPDSKSSWEYTTNSVSGTISYSDKIATFTPNSDLEDGTLYTFTVTEGVKNSENIALENDHEWSFTTSGTSDARYSDKQNKMQGMHKNEYSENTADTTLNANKIRIDLGKAGQFVILAQTNIINKSESMITGHIGEGSVEDGLKKENYNSDSERQGVTGQALVLESNLSDTTSPDVSEAIEDMLTAYSYASMQNGDDVTVHETGGFHSNDLTPGVHEWSDSLHIASDVKLYGGEDDVWLIKIGSDLTIDENIVFTLNDGAQSDNIFWYVEGEVTIGKNANFEGIILSMNEITLEDGATLTGRMFSQASITLNDNTVTEPRNMMAGRTTSTN
ncbi:ice-binding family protein [Rhodohalobacter barkolensis]|uniref:SbsA Ig-like domain-containing protein n=1 Tax=Rhodohalobacter barkolensis TaxID=2053187 RepID=A0A2N0VJG0_9BACT|nr:ice-binding family protein [Rhodohalobacter barkolensis]PKD44335.1 hypothetical protein CWD77_02375 [Rhodohalobacter barkolensis]